jgi:methionine aminopeptidase
MNAWRIVYKNDKFSLGIRNNEFILHRNDTNESSVLRFNESDLSELEKFISEIKENKDEIKMHGTIFDRIERLKNIKKCIKYAQNDLQYAYHNPKLLDEIKMWLELIDKHVNFIISGDENHSPISDI